MSEPTQIPWHQVETNAPPGFRSAPGLVAATQISTWAVVPHSSLHEDSYGHVPPHGAQYAFGSNATPQNLDVWLLGQMPFGPTYAYETPTEPQLEPPSTTSTEGSAQPSSSPSSATLPQMPLPLEMTTPNANVWLPSTKLRHLRTSGKITQRNLSLEERLEIWQFTNEQDAKGNLIKSQNEVAAEYRLERTLVYLCPLNFN